MVVVVADPSVSSLGGVESEGDREVGGEGVLMGVTTRNGGHTHTGGLNPLDGRSSGVLLPLVAVWVVAVGRVEAEEAAEGEFGGGGGRATVSVTPTSFGWTTGITGIGWEAAGGAVGGGEEGEKTVTPAGFEPDAVAAEAEAGVGVSGGRRPDVNVVGAAVGCRF